LPLHTAVRSEQSESKDRHHTAYGVREAKRIRRAFPPHRRAWRLILYQHGQETDGCRPIRGKWFCNKFNLLMAHHAAEAERRDLINVVADLENTRIQQSAQLLTRIRLPSTAGGSLHASLRFCVRSFDGAGYSDCSMTKSFQFGFHLRTV